MKIKWLVLLVGVLAMAGIATASNLVTCDLAIATPGAYFLAGTAGTASVLVSNGTFSCEEGDTEFTFTAASYVPNGAALLPANDVTVNALGTAGASAELQFQVGINSPWDYADGGFSVTFTAQVCNTAICGVLAAPQTFITQADTQESPPTRSGLVSSSINGIAATLGGGGANYQAPLLPSVLSVTYIESYTPVSTDIPGVAIVTGITNDADETVGPEPSTMMLMGGALVGLGIIGRKRRKSI